MMEEYQLMNSKCHLILQRHASTTIKSAENSSKDRSAV
jgi:hypothetical protein